PGDLFEVYYNLRVGTLYLAYLLDRFEGDITLALAAYHMGPTSVAKGIQKYPDLSSRDMVRRLAGPQTQAYVDRVLGMLE
ncbi:MAG: transglycosylase SLT domain-containing protein, partial [Planctomycetota bacterium]